MKLPTAGYLAARPRTGLMLGRIRFIALGAVIGLTWAASLRVFMMVLVGPDSTFTFTGTFGIILPTGIIVGALLGWAEHQRRTGPQYGLLILAPLLIGLIPNLATAGVDPGPYPFRRLVGRDVGFGVGTPDSLMVVTLAVGLIALPGVHSRWCQPRGVVGCGGGAGRGDRGIVGAD